jgi:hypothetical protein
MKQGVETSGKATRPLNQRRNANQVIDRPVTKVAQSGKSSLGSESKP